MLDISSIDEDDGSDMLAPLGMEILLWLLYVECQRKERAVFVDLHKAYKVIVS